MSSELNFFAIHALDGRAAQDELNGFLAQHRVLTIEKQWLAAGLDSHWVVCVGVANGPGALPDAAKVGGGKPGRPARVDYREVLSPADFAVFASLRSLRQQLGEREGVPPYVLFTSVRYMDDILWWCDSRAEAQATLGELSDFLWRERRLRLKPSAAIAPSRSGVAWCGYRIHQALILPSRRKLARYRRHARQLEAAWADGLLSAAELQRAGANSIAPLARSHSIGFRQGVWHQRPSIYDATDRE